MQQQMCRWRSSRERSTSSAPCTSARFLLKESKGASWAWVGRAQSSNCSRSCHYELSWSQLHARY